jgi:predicted RecA/RadA family phage recombinase
LLSNGRFALAAPTSRRPSVPTDNAARNATTVSTSNKLIGVATAVANNPSAVGRVRLNGAFIS